MATERERRIYYQGIVYEICNILGTKIVCGTADEPSTELQDVIAVARRQDENAVKLAEAILAWNDFGIRLSCPYAHEDTSPVDLARKIIESS